jgi:peptide/nickel transport system permease protein
MSKARAERRAQSAEGLRGFVARWGVNAIVGWVVLLGLLFCAGLGLVWTPYSVTEQDFSVQLQGPSLAHPLGTDNFGRDTLSRLLRGASTSVLVGLVSVGIGSSLGLLLGMLAAWLSGFRAALFSSPNPARARLGWLLARLEDGVLIFLDALSAFPTILLALLLATALRPSVWSAMLAVGLSNIPVFARLTRAGALATQNLDFVDAARALGAGDSRLLFRYVLPNIAPALIVQATFSFGIAILAEAALSYLGLGMQPPNPSWGVMLRDAQTFITQSAWASVFPGLTIAITVLGLNLLGDGLRDALDPRD